MARRLLPVLIESPLRSCILESDVDTMEISLRRRMEDLISQGDIEGADKIDNTIKNLDKINICEPEDEEL